MPATSPHPVWRSPAERDFELLIMPKEFSIIKSKLDELRPITTQEGDLKLIDGCQARRMLRQAWRSFWTHWTEGKGCKCGSAPGWIYSLSAENSTDGLNANNPMPPVGAAKSSVRATMIIVSGCRRNADGASGLATYITRGTTGFSPGGRFSQ